MRLILLSLLTVFCTFPVYAQGQCEDAAIAGRVSEALKDTSKTPAGRDADTQVHMGIARGHIKAEKKEQMVAALVEFTLRKSAQCHIPNRLKTVVSSGITIGKKAGEKCEVGRFSKIVNRQYNTLKASTDFEAFETMIRAQVTGNMIDSVAGIFGERWDRDAVFRANAIKAGLEMGIMITNDCANPQDPVLNVIAAF